jgi:alpha-N-arabinofuranosidase
MRARLKVDPERVIGRIDRNIFGQFMSRRPGCSEDGLYAPDSPTADAYGIRRDVSQALADLKPSVIRWPGGSTGASYHWLDGVGPVGGRPKKIDLSFGWPTRHEFGTHEFITWCRRIGAEPHLNFAMGTGTLEEAAAWLEYCNSPLDTNFANLRRKHGQDAPYAVKYWQLGNEMYGTWELGYCKPGDYAAQAREWAKILRKVDPSIKLLAVGGDGDDNDGQWAWEVVPEVARYVDYVAFHTYWGSPGPAGSDPWYQLLAGPHRAERKIEQLAAIIETVELTQRARRRGLRIACTEWNTTPGFSSTGGQSGLGTFQPRYHLHDALAVATFANIMQRHCRQITLATIAQSINVVGLVVVDEQGMVLEPTYWAWRLATNYGGSLAVDTWVEGETFACPERRLADLPYLDASASLEPDTGRLYLSLVNRHLTEPIDLEVRLTDASVVAGGLAHMLYHDDPQAMNSHDQPENVRARTEPVALDGSRFTHELPPHSYTVLELPLTR